MFDLILRGGMVIDGTRRPRVRADVGVRGDRIAAIGDLHAAESRAVLDVTGRVVAPGFVDVHNHSDGWLLRTPHLLPKTRQGFTAEVLMADGISYAPVSEYNAREWLFYLRSLNGLRMDEYRGWRTLAEYMEQLDGRCAQNVMTHVPYANVRALACGFGRQAVDDVQRRHIQLEIRRGMEAGAVGLSTGLDYIVQCFATTDELAAACAAVAEYDGLYVTHLRYKHGLMTALREAVEIARRAGVRLHVSHLKGLGGCTAAEVLEYIDTVARHEVDLSFDVYPYQPGSTMLNSLLPYEVWERGPLAVLGELARPELRPRFRAAIETHRLDLDHLHIAWVAGKENARHQGKPLSAYVAEMGLPPEEALLNLLIEERLAVLLVFHEGADELIRPLLQHDLYMMGTDGIYHADGVIHPRMYGSAGRLLGPCVRDQKLFSLEDAVYKLSAHAAARFGMTDRGTLREGHFADVVVFDPETVTDRATFADPHQPTTGIDHVLVNGNAILCHGEPVECESWPGRFLRFKS